MEDRWILIIALIVLACIPLQVMAYDNIKAHPKINELAIQYFEEKILPKDPLLKNTSIRGEESWGYAWDETDGIVKIGPRNEKSIPRKKLLHQWIEDGGFSADEPEYTMALVHFYDPINYKEPWLTDPWWIMNKYTEFLARAGFSLNVPDLSAVHWAFDDGGGASGEQGQYFIQDYSWNDGLRYYKDALASTSCCNEKYGQAWRAVGETMHLVSDMTVPAHVRNDGHIPVIDGDPFELSVGAREVTYYYKNGAPLKINYDQGTLQDVMIRIATKVNENFYSADTTPVYTATISNREWDYKYMQPSLFGRVSDANRYYYDEAGRALAREDTLYYISSLTPGKAQLVYHLDLKVLTDQRKVLIPTAIQASAEVLDRFLPRFEAIIKVEKYVPDDPSDEQYLVRSTLKQVHSEPDAWSGHDLIVRNGAYLVEKLPDGREIEYLLSPTPANLPSPQDPNFNNWQDIHNFIPGTKVYMYYDLGGYVIKSNEVKIPKVTPTTPDGNWERDPKECPSNWYIDGVCQYTTDTIRMCGDIPCSQLPSSGRVSPDWTPPPIQ